MGNPNTKLTDRLTIVTDADVLERIREIAEDEDRSLSYIANKALKEFVERTLNLKPYPKR